MEIPKEVENQDVRIFDRYEFMSSNVPVKIVIQKTKDEFIPTYVVSIPHISDTTDIILDQIRNEIIKESSIEIKDILDIDKKWGFEDDFINSIKVLVKKYLPDLDNAIINYLVTYVINKSLGLGRIEILMDDQQLEEIAINNAREPVWIYHRKYGWMKTNVFLKSEEEINHYSTMIGRKVDRQISILNPLLDANLSSGDRVNATLNPISLRGNTITLRKFANKPWTITDFIKNETTNVESASLLWLCVQYEMSVIIAGGTASGKTSMLNVCANFFPPNQRIISIEDTHELRLPMFLHWVPMITRQPNPEGKGGVSMLDLLVNSLRMRPDRIIVGEIRRQKEAEVLFEAIHTGHSVYATVHANSAEETITRLTNPPIDIPKSMLPAISLILVQYRNRRTGLRRTFQVAEINDNAEARTLLQFNQKSDDIEKTQLYKSVSKKSSKIKSSLFSKLQLFTGMSINQLLADLKEKEKVLKWLVLNDINFVDEVGEVMALYYTRKEHLMELVNKNISMKES
jgi:flagellar protein FlaI